MPRCQGIKRDGGRCTVGVPAGVQWCFNHDPARSEERNASRAGKSSGGREVRDLKRRISAVVDDVLEDRVDRGRAAVAIQGLNALRGALELERRVREVDELAERLSEIERRLGAARREEPFERGARSAHKGEDRKETPPAEEGRQAHRPATYAGRPTLEHLAKGA